MPTAETKGFEAGVVELEAIVQQLESGDLSLEDALGAFERGVGLVRTLHTALNQAEQRVEVLTRDAAGEVHLEALAREKGGQ